MAKWRANIGLISPAQSVAESAFNKYAPEGVEIATTRIKLKAFPTEPDDGFITRLEAAAETFSELPKDIIIFGCTVGSCINGTGWDQECIRRMEERCHSRCTTTINACMESFDALGVKNIAMITPYPEYKTQIQKKFLEDHGYRITAVKILDVQCFNGDVPQGFIYKQARTMDLSNAEALFISCMKLHTMEIVEPLETDLGIPVISSHQARLWSVLRRSGVNERMRGLGRLMEL